MGHGDGISIPSASHSPVHHLFHLGMSLRIPSEKKLEVQLALASTSKAHTGSENDENPLDFGGIPGIPVFRPIQYVNTIYTFNHHCPFEKCLFESQSHFETNHVRLYIKQPP